MLQLQLHHWQILQRHVPGMKDVVVQRNFVGCGVRDNLASDVWRQEGKRYFVASGKHDDVGACGAAVIKLYRALADAFDVWPQDDAAAGNVVHERSRDGGLALCYAHFRVESPSKEHERRDEMRNWRQARTI